MDPSEKTQKFLYRHPWEISRRNMILGILKEYDKNYQYVDFGAGDLFVISKLKEYSNKPIFVIDNTFSKNYKKDNIIILKDIEEIPKNSVDIILLLDVLEHIDDESSLLKNFITLLKSDGKLIITVPAFQFLYTQRDYFLNHFRRYSIKKIKKLLTYNGFEIKETFYFYTIGFVFRSIEILLFQIGVKKKFRHTVSEWKYNEMNIITKLFENLLNVDFTINRKLQSVGIYLPGLSVCAICHQKFS